MDIGLEMDAELEEMVEVEDEEREDSKSVVHLIMSLEGRFFDGLGALPLVAPGHQRTDVGLDVSERFMVVELGGLG